MATDWPQHNIIIIYYWGVYNNSRWAVLCSCIAEGIKVIILWYKVV